MWIVQIEIWTVVRDVIRILVIPAVKIVMKMSVMVKINFIDVLTIVSTPKRIGRNNVLETLIC